MEDLWVGLFFFLFGSDFSDEKRRLEKKGLKNCVEDLAVSPSKKLELLVIWMMILVSYTYFWEKTMEKKIAQKIHIFVHEFQFSAPCSCSFVANSVSPGRNIWGISTSERPKTGNH